MFVTRWCWQEHNKKVFTITESSVYANNYFRFSDPQWSQTSCVESTLPHLGTSVSDKAHSGWTQTATCTCAPLYRPSSSSLRSEEVYKQPAIFIYSDMVSPKVFMANAEIVTVPSIGWLWYLEISHRTTLWLWSV